MLEHLNEIYDCQLLQLRLDKDLKVFLHFIVLLILYDITVYTENSRQCDVIFLSSFYILVLFYMVLHELIVKMSCVLDCQVYFWN